MESTERNITDQFGRVHDYLRISLTERCNLRCFYCMPEEGIQLRPRSEFMTNEEVVAMAKIFVSLGVKKIRLTGGEPLVRNDAKEIIKELSQLPVEIAITTNGILVDKFIDNFISSGLKSVNVSLDSLQREKLNKITRRDYFDTILSNIHLLIKNNFHVKLNAVIIRDVNDNEIIDFIEFTKDNNVHFRFIEFMPFDGNKWDWSKGLSYKEILDMVKLNYRNNFSRIEDKKNDTSKNFRVNGYKGTFAIISSVTNPFCDRCNRIRLTSDGKIKNCLFSDSETDLLSVMRRGEDIVPIIQETVWHKKLMRGGMNTLVDLGKQKNRSMVAIGG
ncbi:MAG: GTP 3',8-cyclase MoaA [Bacteroidota bacterium]